MVVGLIGPHGQNVVKPVEAEYDQEDVTALIHRRPMPEQGVTANPCRGKTAINNRAQVR